MVTSENYRWVVRLVGGKLCLSCAGVLIRIGKPDVGRLTSVTMMSATASVVPTQLAPSIVRGSLELSLSGCGGAKCWDWNLRTRDLQHNMAQFYFWLDYLSTHRLRVAAVMLDGATTSDVVSAVRPRIAAGDHRSPPTGDAVL